MLCSYILSAATPRTLNDNVIVYGYKCADDCLPHDLNVITGTISGPENIINA